ncbi:VWA domain-containing protein [Methylobacterium sp. C25]|uniref:vWA domain-containing protein n=1 Tax=Methylobacterium sp. C25 TaxID=2721622 RepID=UPI001F1A0CDF|nr:VWA domain-containing protein [Methylobacterium sp. C25]MCE4223325.1 VWA domain-containing protein [Methylobacterium sp. C25]
MSGALAAFHFERPLWLLLLVLAAAFWFLARRLLDGGARWQGVIDPELLRHLLLGQAGYARVNPNGLLLFAWLLASIAVAGPAWQREPSPFADAKPPVVIVLKVSPSMTKPDLAPTRLDRAREKLSDLLAIREGASAGLIAYSGSAHMVLPPTPDTGVIGHLAQALAPEIMPKEGDDLAQALAIADRVLAAGGQVGSILVMTDGVAAEELGPLETIKLAHPVTMLSLLPPDQPLETLDEAARAIRGRLIATTVDQSDIDAIARRLDRAARTEEVAGEGQHWREAGYWLTPILALLTLLWFRRGWVLA